jgi:Rieske Fe-S protein
MSDQPTSRRSVLVGIAVTAAAGIAGYSVARASDLTKPRSATSGANGYGPSAGAGTFLADVQQIPPVGGGLILSQALVVLVREADGSVKGFSATCTHQGCTVASVQGGIISCPCHGSQFSAKNGAVVQGPAPRPLPSVPVVVRGAGVYTE